jgi:hypothetical protein
MAHAQKPDFVFRRNGRVHLNQQGRQFSRLLAAEVCASAVVMLDTPCSEVVWRVLATHTIHQFPLHFPSRASPRAITFQLESYFLSSKADTAIPTEAEVYFTVVNCCHVWGASSACTEDLQRQACWRFYVLWFRWTPWGERHVWSCVGTKRGPDGGVGQYESRPTSRSDRRNEGVLLP